MKILFLASIATKRKHFDGERNKSLAIANSLKRKNEVICYNLNGRFRRPLSMLRFLFRARFGHYDLILVCKSPTGCSTAYKALRRLNVKTDKLVLYPYGRGLEGKFQSDPNIARKVLPEAFLNAKALIVENGRSKQSYAELGCKNIFFVPVVKKIFDIPESKAFREQQTLHAIFWARIAAAKGVLDAIEAVQRINAGLPIPKYTLDIAGGDPEADVEEKIKRVVNEDHNIVYYGTSFTVQGEETYHRLQDYDLHVFPSYYNHECAPGSVVDMFIAGVPTLSSTFPGYEAMMNNDNSYFAPAQNVDALVERLNYIHDHQEELYQKRRLCRLEAPKYSEDAFLDVFEQIVK